MLKDTEINQGVIYLGKHAGKEILNSIEQATHSIEIITPYISSDYIELLKTKVYEGLEVKLILSSDIGGEKDKYKSLTKLISQKKHTNFSLKEKRDKYLKFTNIAFIFVLLTVILGVYYVHTNTSYLLVTLPLLYLIKKKLLSLIIYTYTYYSDLLLSIPMSPYTNGYDPSQTLVHAKLFIIDDTAYMGSVNFTKAAFWKNYETRIKLIEPDIINKLRQEFQYVYSNNKTRYLDISSMGRRIYSEPPH
jgi:phosphatidylserine/phosphatidylglycerophosphate/cardiolipin synthase-like enzyme